jgi:hypothetical protein
VSLFCIKAIETALDARKEKAGLLKVIQGLSWAFCLSSRGFYRLVGLKRFLLAEQICEVVVPNHPAQPQQHPSHMSKVTSLSFARLKKAFK